MNLLFKNRKYKTGLTIVEALIAIAVFVVLLLAVIGVYNFYLRIALSNGTSIKATFLAQEGLEAVRFMRDQSWDNITSLSVDTSYGVVFESGTWAATTTEILIDSLFNREVILSEVYRDDATSQIVSSGGTLDPDTLKVTLNISWSNHSATTTKTVSTYISNIHEEE